MSKYNGGFAAAVPTIVDLHDRGLSPKQIEEAISETEFRDRFGNRPSRGMIQYILQREGMIEDSRPPLDLDMTAAHQDLLALPTNKLLDRSLNEFEFSTRVSNCLKNSDIFTFRDLVQYSAKDMLRIPYFGRLCLTEVTESLASIGLSLRDSEGFSTRDRTPSTIIIDDTLDGRVIIVRKTYINGERCPSYIVIKISSTRAKELANELLMAAGSSQGDNS